MKKDKNILIIVLIAFVSVVVQLLLSFLLIFWLSSIPAKKIDGIENYSKLYYIETYGGELDSNLSVFPDDTSILIEPTFKSSMLMGLLDTEGYIILTSKYSLDNFNKELERLSVLSMTIKEGCFENSNTYTNYVKYDTTSYEYPSYITIDGYRSRYEYALINKDELEITYVYLSYPEIYNTNYRKYLKKDKGIYFNDNTLALFSMYHHTFDNGKSYMEFGDC